MYILKTQFGTQSQSLDDVFEKKTQAIFFGLFNKNMQMHKILCPIVTIIISSVLPDPPSKHRKSKTDWFRLV